MFEVIKSRASDENIQYGCYELNFTVKFEDGTPQSYRTSHKIENYKSKDKL